MGHQYKYTREAMQNMRAVAVRGTRTMPQQQMQAIPTRVSRAKDVAGASKASSKVYKRFHERREEKET